MKLYFSPGACSLSPHIVLREAGLPFELEQVNMREKKTKAGADYLTINPKGAVPALHMDDGQLLTEVAAIVQYLADLKPEKNLAPKPGTLERVRLQEWLNYIGTELHKSFGAFFSSKAIDDWKSYAKEGLTARFDFVSKQLEGKQYLLGDTFTVADTYLFTILTWMKFAKIDPAQWPTLQQYYGRIRARPSVSEALEVEKRARA
jgi:glutathione S-transferase